ncbi:MAG: ATP-binding protein [Nitrososphaerota archaeon]|nr:ATP-binding protein [Nitrososphaerota archaeon]
MISRFIDREKELSLLEGELAAAPSLVVLHGRRRVGKTRLLQEFTRGRRSLTYTFADASKEIQIREFLRAVARFLGDALVEKLKTDSWHDVFEYLSAKLEDGTCVVLDEFTYAVRQDAKIVSDLQRAWDGSLGRKRVLLLLSGSMMGMMEEKVLSSNSPLYGRRNRDVRLGELMPEHSASFLGDFRRGLEAYMLVGGMPAYLQVASRYRTTKELVEAEFLNQQGYFYREPYFMLAQDLRETGIYFSILNAIAFGNTSANTIANFVGIEARKIYPYIEQMTRLGLVERRTPVLGSGRAGIYRVSDRMVHSWFNLVYAQREAVELEVAVYDRQAVGTVLGVGFESVALHYLVSCPLLPFAPSAAGGWWHKGIEIDAVVADEQGARVAFAEAKWSDLGEREARRALRALEQKSREVAWRLDERENHFCLFARRVDSKASLRRDGYLVWDIEDLAGLSGL